jgi:hypothetical protein
MAEENRFNLGGIDIFAAGNNEVTAPIYDVEVPFAVEIAQIAGMKPLIRTAWRSAKIARRNGWATETDFTDLAGCCYLTRWCDEAQFDR